VRKNLYIILFCSLLIALFGCNLKNKSTTDLPILTQKQMYEDFDNLVFIIENINPQLTIKKKITNIDHLAELKQMRNDVKKCKNTDDFILLINSALTSMQDAHCSILPANTFIMPFSKVKSIYDFDDTIAYNNTVKYVSFIDNGSINRKFSLLLKYINGDYYLCESFIYRNKNYEAGSKLIEFNGENIHSFIQKMKNYRIRMRWDKENKRYYSEVFYISLYLKGIKSFTLSFLTPDKEKITDFFNSEISVNGKPPYTLSKGREKVDNIRYIEKDNVLFIRLRKMNMNEINLNEINEVSKNKQIKKVIIDIRGNSGGDDNVWIKLLSRIIDNPIIYQTKLLLKNTNLIRSIYGKNKLYNLKRIEKESLLDNEEFIVLCDGNDTINPDNNSIKFKGKIYLLQDAEIFSSSLALSTVASRSDKIVSVGKITGWMGGRGVTPLIFVFPNSKLTFTIEPAIDGTNINSINDYWKDTVEVPVKIPLDNYLKKHKGNTNLYEDPYYKKVLEL
jgi:hypothetical protein